MLCQKVFLFLISIAIAATFLSCDVENCVSTKSNNLKVAFFRAENENEYMVQIDSLYAVGGDSVIYGKDTLLQQVVLFLNPAADSTIFKLHYTPYTVDSLFLDPPVNSEFDRTDTTDSEPRTESFTFKYRRAQRLISVDCGVEQNFNNVKAGKGTTTEVEIVNKTVDRFNDLNAKIFLF